LVVALVQPVVEALVEALLALSGLWLPTREENDGPDVNQEKDGAPSAATTKRPRSACLRK